MRRVGLILLIGLLVCACGGERPAGAATPKLVYVKGREFAGSVYVANADGSKRRRLARGAFPAISPNGRWVAYVTPALAELRLISPKGGTFVQTSIDTRELRDAKFSPNSKLVGVAGRDRLWIHNVITGDTVKTPRGAIQGWSFSPDSKKVVFAKATVGSDYPAPSDLYSFDIAAKRSTRIGPGLNPVWTPGGIVYDRLAEMTTGGFPHYELVRDGQPFVSNPPAADDLTSGLTPVAVSGDRLLAVFEGQSRNTPYAVESGSARDLGEHDGLVPTGLSRDGTTVLGHTGLSDPTNPHDVVSLPWGGGAPTVIVKNAIWARWNR